MLRQPLVAPALVAAVEQRQPRSVGGFVGPAGWQLAEKSSAAVGVLSLVVEPFAELAVTRLPAAVGSVLSVSAVVAVEQQIVAENAA